MVLFQKSQVKLLPEELFTALRCCLEDTHQQVCMAAAIALYTLEKPNDKVSCNGTFSYSGSCVICRLMQAEKLLRECLLGGNSADRWAAAQCLAYYEECDSQVCTLLQITCDILPKFSIFR